MSLQVVPITIPRQEPGFDLYQSIADSAGKILENGDVIVVSSKYVANAKNRLLDLNKVRPSLSAQILAKNYHLDPKFAEVILREADMVFGGVTGFVLAAADGLLAPNAGIDRSNVKNGMVVLYPDEPFVIAEQLRRKIFLDFGIHVGVILVDSRLMPARIGTTGVAIGCAGLEPISDVRGKKDLNGNPLKVTMKATADNLASIANHNMGEANESTPIVIIKNSGARLTSRKVMPSEMTISADQCVYIRGFRNTSFK